MKLWYKIKFFILHSYQSILMLEMKTLVPLRQGLKMEYVYIILFYFIILYVNKIIFHNKKLNFEKYKNINDWYYKQ